MTGVAYLDHNAGVPALPQVVAAMAEVLAETGNPSAVHAFGRRARSRIEAARAALAELAGADPAAVVFTSGGTEANALALRGCGRSRVLVSAVEHVSVGGAVAGAETIPVDGDGILDLAALDRLLAADDTPALVSVMLANNETGVIQPVAEAARIAHARGALVHCDAAQAPGRLSLDLSGLGVDFLTLSAHKMGGPAGIGVLIGSKSDMDLAPILLGGGQERRRRAGTENIAGIVGFGVAATLQMGRMAAGGSGDGDAILGMRNLRDRLEAEAMARVPAAVVVGNRAERLANTSCLALPGVPAQVQVMALDLEGVMVSAGAACSSGKVEPSRVLAAMGLPPEVAGCAVRVSLGPASSAAEIEAFLAAWVALARRKGLDVSDAAEAA
ncbi:cysteine desulfurase family protein [Magnetospirillum sp. UT-4]|uniref:cysteine desulfurase family protein n=1 Tax=Magnetospirillum sp. UT-4 TaxID=2681467 RepID=UPI001384D9EF|nr:cysteine desulfurase family protein [Magnetospirillum sp. UT-4]CAA7613534.1 Cysteine desulfurase [Magnetospirillum sp. UT-4]